MTDNDLDRTFHTQAKLALEGLYKKSARQSSILFLNAIYSCQIRFKIEQHLSMIYPS